MNDSLVQRPRRGTRAAQLATSILVFVVMLAIAELALRIFAPLPYSSRLYWVDDGHVKARLQPKQDPVNTSGKVVAINSLGFRGTEPTWKPPAGTLRLVALGGSSTFCYDVSDDAHTWPAVLQAKLSAALDMPVEVINLGLPGYDASNSKVNYMFTARALEPDAVLVYHTWNDLKFLRLFDKHQEGLPREYLSGVASGGHNLPAWQRFFFHSQIVQRVRHVYLRVREARRENTYTSMEAEGEVANRMPSDRAFDLFEKSFEDIAVLARSDGVLPIFISQATLAHLENLDRPDIRLAIRNNLLGMTQPVVARAWLESNRRIEAAARERDAIFIDGYGAVPPTLDNFKDHVHLLDRGTELLAQSVAEQLLADPRFQARAGQARQRR